MGSSRQPGGHALPRREIWIALALAVSLAGCAQPQTSPSASQDAQPLRVVSEQTLKGFAFPESVGYDPQGRVLYVSEFGSALKPLEKDGRGWISRVSLTG
jgi:hypothetical protein